MSRPKKPRQLQRPFAKRLISWHGVEVFCCYSQTEWRDWPPPLKLDAEKRAGAILKSERPLLTGAWATRNKRKREAAAARKRDRRLLIELHIAARLDEYAEVRGALFSVGCGGDYGRNDTLTRIRKTHRNHPLKPASTDNISPYFSEILDRIGLPKIEK